MRILDLSLTGFRNYESFQCAFDPGVNLIVGQNAQGKTNLLEALKAVPTAEVTLLLSGGLSPILLVPCEGEKTDFTYLIQPVRLN